MKQKIIQFSKAFLLASVAFFSHAVQAQTTVTLPQACNTCATPCTPPTALTCDPAATISQGATATSTVTGGTGGTITWDISPTTGVSTTSGTGSTTGAITFATAGSYTVTFTSTNNSSPAACNPPASVTCSRVITVNAGPAVVLNCASAVPLPVTFRSDGTAYSGTATLSYTGGTGIPYAAGSAASTGVSGFTASWPAGTLANGAGSISISITGSSLVGGTAEFPITIAGQSCTIRIFGCGAFTAPGVWKEFLCHNLGANTTLDPHDMAQTDAWGLNGAYVQWGRRGPNTTGDSRVDWVTATNTSTFKAAPTGSTLATANDGAIAGWSTTFAPDYAWRTAGGAKTANDPCPTGWRVPTAAEWQGVINNNTTSISGTWVGSPTNYNSARHLGPNATTKHLTLPATGTHSWTGALTSQRGQVGFYWSSSEEFGAAQPSASYMNFSQWNIVVPATYAIRSGPMSIRCIKE